MRQLSFLDACYAQVAHIPRLVALSKFPLLRNHVDDLAQAAALELWRAMLLYRPSIGDLHAYASRVCFNACVSEARRIRKCLADELTGDVPQSSPDPDTSGWLFRHLLKREAKALSLTAVWGYHDWEAAKLMGMKRPAFRALLTGAAAQGRAAVESEAA